jgi:hypothetical protein
VKTWFKVEDEADLTMMGGAMQVIVPVADLQWRANNEVEPCARLVLGLVLML